MFTITFTPADHSRTRAHRRASHSTGSFERLSGPTTRASTAPTMVATISVNTYRAERNGEKRAPLTSEGPIRGRACWGDQVGVLSSANRRGLPEDLLHSSESVHPVERFFGVRVDLAVGVRGRGDEPVPGRAGHLLRLLLRHVRRPGGAPDQDPDGSGAGSGLAVGPDHVRRRPVPADLLVGTVQLRAAGHLHRGAVLVRGGHAPGPVH